MIQKTMELPGWTYKDLPRMTEDLMIHFINIAGEENLSWVTKAQYPDKTHSKTVRGQVMISPKGMDNIKKHCENIEE